MNVAFLGLSQRNRYVVLGIALSAITVGCGPEKPSIFVWHAYRGDEEKALEQATRRWEEKTGNHVDLLAIPHGAYAAKLEAAIPHGHGPDLFIDAHERLGSFVRDGLVAKVDDKEIQAFATEGAARRALTVAGKGYGFPLASKGLALIVNRQFVPNKPASFEALFHGTYPAGIKPLAYEIQSAYGQAPFVHAFGSHFIAADGTFGFVGEPAEKSLDLVAGWQKRGVVVPDADGALVSQLFAAERVAAVISGPWFLADFSAKFPIDVYPLPPLYVPADVPPAGAPASTGDGPLPRPFLTVEAAFLTPDGATRPEVHDLANFLATDPDSLRLRATVGKQVVALAAGVDLPATTVAFGKVADQAELTPTSPAMRATWVPVEQALKKVLRGDATSHDAVLEAGRRFADATKPPLQGEPPPKKTPLFVVFGMILLGAVFAAIKQAKQTDIRAELRRSKTAYAYVTHAAIIVALLVVAPLVAGAATSLYAGTRSDPTYVGFTNYIDILTARGGALLGHGSFYLTLLVTVLWTIINVFFHVSIGLLLGVVLSRESLRLKPLYRTLLILPWAIPSYVTALSWKGMFHKQYGAVNGILHFFGVAPVSWFSKFSTAFTANITTNVWLGFPFMMVVTMGALTSIPKDVLEAADVDGATPWQRFRYVTLPLLRPALLPSVALGAVWTFNMFNVVFLVSEGEPDGTTDILVSDAYRWAFTRDAQYGYAAAYAVVIFGILFLGSRALQWLGERFSGTSEASK